MSDSPTEPDWAALAASAPRPLTAEWLRSPAYDALMNRWRKPEDGNDEAQRTSRSYVHRHATLAPILGAWRWRGMHEHRDMLLDALGSGVVIDFGGAAGPLGIGSVVVDSMCMFDAWGGPVTLGSTRMLADRSADAVFSSHTLEHVDDLDDTLREMRRVLKPGGKLVAHVPSWTCERWHAGVHKSVECGDHRWTFGIEKRPWPIFGLQGYDSIDYAAIRNGFEIVRAWYCGDNSIMLIGEKAA